MELPPLDDDDDETIDPALEEGLTPLEDDGEDPLDDAAAEELEIGVEIGDDDNDPTGGDEAAEDGIDVGPLDEEILEEGEDSEGLTDEHQGSSGGFEDDLDNLDDGDDDGGQEGTGEPIEDEVNDEDLPELDADEGGDFDGEDLIAELEEQAMDDVLPPWDPARWLPCEGAGAVVPCCAVAVNRGRVAAVGDVVLLVDEGAHAARRVGASAGGVALAIADAAIFVATARGSLLAFSHAGAGPSVVSSWRARRGVLDLSAIPGRLWIRSNDALWRIPESVESLEVEPGSPVSVRERGVAAIAVSGGALIALTLEAGGASIERRRGDDEGWQVMPLTGDALRVACSEKVRVVAAAGGGALCLADPARNICVSRDAGASFHSVPLLRGAVAVAFAGDDLNAPLLAVLESEEGACIVQVPASGRPTRVAEIAVPGSDEAEPTEDSVPLGPSAIAWDATREVAWIASRAGLIAFGRARKH